MNVTVQSPQRGLIHRIFFNRSEPRSGWRLLIFITLVVAFIKTINFAVRRILPGADETTLFLVREVSDFSVFLLASWIMGRMEKRTIADYGLPWQRMFRAQFWHGIAIGFAFITGLLLAMRAFGLFRIERIALHGFEIWKWAIIYVLVFILVALREEFRARGYGLYTLTTGIGFWPAAIISAMYFGYSHYWNAGETWIGLFNAAAFGLLVCFLLRRTGDLWMPIGLHTAFDWGETYFYGVANSGGSYPGHLLDSSLSGPNWLSGGTAGPEGSVLCTALIVVVWLLCAAWLRESKYPARVNLMA